MSQFKYILPSGAEFTLNAPMGTTQVQADRIFYEQVAAGVLVGYEAGQTLTSPATQITKFELSRLDRGTAGVETSPILAINQGLQSAVATPSLQAQSVLAAIQALPIPIGIPNLGEVPLIRPVDEADVILARGNNFAPASIGANGITALTSFQVQKIQAQIINLVGQPSNEISRDKGIGQYGFNCTSLEQAGYVKPGTCNKFFAVDSENFVEVMSSPSVWTGKNGVYSLTDLLNNFDLQNQIQTQLMQQGYDSLLASGTITTVAQPSVSVSTGQVYTNTGLQSISTLSAVALLSAGSGSVNLAARTAENTVASVGRLLSGTNLNLATIGSGAVNSLSAGRDRLGSLADVNFAGLSTGLTNQITGGVGSLVANASKFGGRATALWARTGNLNFSNIGTDLSRIAGTQLPGAVGNLGGSLNTITGQLTNLVPGSLSNLTGNLNVFGKAGSFATNFANPLGTLNSLPNFGTLTAGLTGLTGQFNTLTAGLTGQLTGALRGLPGQLTGTLGSFGSFANLGSIGSLFGGGGDLVSGTQVAGGFNNTVNRATVDAAFARVVGSDKVPLPTFQYPSIASLAPRLDIQQAQNFLRNLPSSTSPTFGQTVTV
jgi:hypothetical protein